MLVHDAQLSVNYSAYLVSLTLYPRNHYSQLTLIVASTLADLRAVIQTALMDTGSIAWCMYIQ